MLEPVGPLPEAVYRRRRAAALAALIIALLLGLWGVSALAGDEDPGEPAAPGPASSTGATASAPTTTSTPTSHPAPASTAPPSTPNLASTAAPPPPAAPPAPPAPPGPCPDEVVGLSAQAGKPEYRVGEDAEFRLVATNTGPVPCFRDLDSALQEVLLLGAGGQDRVWSSNDCYTRGSEAVRLLAPGEQVVSSVVWRGRTSAPGCPVKRETVPAGDYQLVVRLGALTSPPTPFRLLN